MKATNERGIVIIATGNFNYLHMAFNLACSLRVCGTLPVTLITDEQGERELTEFQKFQFQKVIALSQAETANPFLLKLYIDQLSPYEYTLFVDADTLWMPFKKTDNLFNELKDVDFTIANRGKFGQAGQSDWKAEVEPDHIDCASEFIYFHKCDKVTELFDKARTYYLTNNEVNRTIGGFQPDEPAITFAMHATGITPHKMPFHPTYWEPHGYQAENNIKNNYYLLSMGGNRVSGRIQKIYNTLAQYYANELGVVKYPHVNKHKQKERITF